MNWFDENIATLKLRFPGLADRVLRSGLNEQIGVLPAKDGMPAYGIRQGSTLQPLTNAVNPIEEINQELTKWHEKTNDFSRPILVVGLNPGAEVLHLFQQREQATGNECAQPLWICIDSILTFCGFLQTYDARALMASKRVELFWHEDVAEKVAWLEEHSEFPYLFSMISLASPEVQMSMFSPFLKLARERDEQMAEYQEINNAHYDAINDEQLAQVISGKGGRRPRLLVPSCPWSTVIQYSIRDTCRAFEKAGWETQIVEGPAVLTSHCIMESINRFKPDLFLYVDHLRTEAPGVLPDNLMVVSWVQDPLPWINSPEVGQQWSKYVAPRNRDLLTGYVDQLRSFGYTEERLVALNMIVDTDVFRPRTLSDEQKEKYTCDVCFASNAGLPTDRVVRERLVPLLVPFGLDETLAMEIHDRIWVEYRTGKTITCYDQLRTFLLQSSSFKGVYEVLTNDQQDALLELLFWRLNDVIYRHVVLEWLDDYAQIHPDFRLNIYGNDWDKHPRFAPYACGSVEHGEELSLAFQCARFSLHLNAAEGSHQRLNEVLASGGMPLLRHNDDKTIIVPELAAALRQLFASGETASTVELTERESGAWNTFLYKLAERELYANRALSHEQLCQRVHEEVMLRLAIYPDWMLSNWVGLTFNQRAGLAAVLEQHFSDNVQTASSMFPMLSQASHVERLCSEMTKRLGMECIFSGDKLPGLEMIVSHIRSLYKRPLPTDWPERVRQVCKLCPDEINLYSKAAWSQFIETNLAYEKALPWMAKDWDAGRMEGEWLLLYAQARAACGEDSNLLVDYAYETDSNLTNGYARCAWMKYFTLDYQPKKALCGFEKDLQLGRLSGLYKLNYAILLACIGLVDSAEASVAEAYRLGRDCDNGYTLLDWVKQVILKRNDEMIFERDKQLGRSAPWGLVTVAGVLARKGLRSEAEACVKEAYEASASNMGAYTTVATIDYLINRDMSYTQNLLEYDNLQGRLLPFHRIVRAAFLQLDDQKAAASECCQVAAEHSSLAWQIAVSWLHRCGYDTPMVNKLLTPELESYFDAKSEAKFHVSGR